MIKQIRSFVARGFKTPGCTIGQHPWRNPVSHANERRSPKTINAVETQNASRFNSQLATLTLFNTHAAVRATSGTWTHGYMHILCPHWSSERQSWLLICHPVDNDMSTFAPGSSFSAFISRMFWTSCFYAGTWIGRSGINYTRNAFTDVGSFAWWFWNAWPGNFLPLTGAIAIIVWPQLINVLHGYDGCMRQRNWTASERTNVAAGNQRVKEVYKI